MYKYNELGCIWATFYEMLFFFYKNKNDTIKVSFYYFV
nr:MAG TPA: hypothetical protein [Caudoviricetes sp.]